MSIIKFFKQLFCSHYWQYTGGSREEGFAKVQSYKCAKYGKEKWF